MTRTPFILLTVAAGLSLAACDTDTTAPEGASPVAIGFGTAPAATASSPVATAPKRNVVAQGTNGTLEITDVILIVSEFELEGADDACLDPDDDDLDDCADFEAPPFLLELPLDGSTVTVAVGDVPPGTYHELEFEVEDLELDDDDDGQELEPVWAEARNAHTDWPDEASMVVEGTFTPENDATARTFRVFVDAEIEVEMELDEPLVVEADQAASVTVLLDPGTWFTRADGSVLDLSAFDYDGDESDIIELEAEFEDGVVEIEFDDD